MNNPNERRLGKNGKTEEKSREDSKLVVRITNSFSTSLGSTFLSDVMIEVARNL